MDVGERATQRRDNRKRLGLLSAAECRWYRATQTLLFWPQTHGVIPVLWSRWNLSASGPWRVKEICPFTPTSGSEADTFSTNLLEGEFSITTSVYTTWSRSTIIIIMIIRTIIRPPLFSGKLQRAAHVESLLIHEGKHSVLWKKLKLFLTQGLKRKTEKEKNHLLLIHIHIVHFYRDGCETLTSIKLFIAQDNFAKNADNMYND